MRQLYQPQSGNILHCPLAHFCFAVDNEFEFAEEVFDNGQIASRDYITFLVSRGVSLDFALKTLAYSANDAWCPSREELLMNGVLTDPADNLPRP